MGLDDRSHIIDTDHTAHVRSTLWLLGPRFAFLIYWLIPWGRVKVTAAFGGSWFWPILGLIFLPWTTLMFTLVYPIIGLDWLWLGLAVLADISAYAAGAAQGCIVLSRAVANEEWVTERMFILCQP